MELANALSKIEGIDGVNLSLYEVDQQTETVKVTIQGARIDYRVVESVIKDFGDLCNAGSLSLSF
jgi:hypothetical protein